MSWQKEKISTEDFSDYHIYTFLDSIFAVGEAGLYSIIIENKKLVTKILLISKNLKNYQISELNNEMYIFGRDGMFQVDLDNNSLIKKNNVEWAKEKREYVTDPVTGELKMYFKIDKYR
jgi:hypothetical protein